ncbi:MAG: type II toxin-antitoxin system RatA family toxin [Pseudomonadota bacterium]
MTVHRDQRRVPYSADAMFDLVADIETYPDYIPWCVGMKMRSRNVEDGSGEMTADMLVGFRGFRERFRSRVHLDRPAKAIDVEYLDGPFRRLVNRWRFIDQDDGGSIIDFHIEFEFRNRLLQATAMQVLDKAFKKLSDAFLKRADEVYGSSNSAVSKVRPREE